MPCGRVESLQITLVLRLCHLCSVYIIIVITSSLFIPADNNPTFTFQGNPHFNMEGELNLCTQVHPMTFISFRIK